ncbi:hypothetical protein CONLIGDRAFT_566813 [Coniochaeta ligniaria NRRL 30616]|uniref:Actin cytoskeleton-regulatory complex protein SLA1 n=1 Tax=Coniochaeta ligniaria NRRL 30616 TaxID=1408157 RepID=A0A1J7K3Q6_9PEZI|nr:hypothetical protein CONLIGDRAFT_566813 [Coniochaeta ligniaria NRRL 30616]
MAFLGVYRALYDYAPQAEGELQISEGDLLYVLEKSEDDDWWKAKKKASEDDEDEPSGLIPSNYIEEAQSLGHARALYEYTRQTDEEISFPEEAKLEVFDTSDPDWILVGHDGEYGFAPANYIELGDGDGHQQPQTDDDDEAPPALPQRSAAPDLASPPLPARNVSEPSSPAAPNPAAALANVMGGRSVSSSHAPAPLQLPPRPQYHSEESEEDNKSPPLPTRPRGESLGSAVEQAYRSPPPPVVDRTSSPRDNDAYAASPQTPKFAPGGFHMYNINEMVSVMGRRKKMPTTLGINLKTGVILIAPERAQDGPSQEWSADRMTHYSREGKHVFMELVRPSKSVDFHAGAKDTAEEIVSALGELAGAVRAEGLREVIEAGTGRGGQKKGVVLYDFMAQGDDEVTVATGDDVIVIDDTKSEEWWHVRRLKNGKEGVVPSSYVEITGSVPTSNVTSPTTASHTPSHLLLSNGKSFAEQNRLDEERLTKEAVRAAARAEEKEKGKRGSEVGPGMRLPERNSSLSQGRDSNNGRQQRSGKRENGQREVSGSSRSSKSTDTSQEPDPSKVRTWTDRSKSFSVEAQFLGLKDGKLNLHKLNGVKIAVPVSKMSLEDLEYVERVTGISLDEDKPLSDLKKRSDAARGSSSAAPTRVGVSIEPQSKKPEYDWFQFFLSCEVAVGLCERYAQAFNRESIDESVLPDVDASVLRNLGLKEGDIIKVMRFLDNKFGRNKKSGGGEDGESGGGLFSGPGGTLRNNTRKGRPAPAVATSDVVDAKAFSLKDGPTGGSQPSPTTATPTGSSAATSAPAPAKKPTSGFDDDAWDVKPSRTPAAEPAPQPARAPEPAPAPTPTPAAAPKPPPLSGAMAELSLLSQPLEPTKAPPPAQPSINLPPAQPLQPQATAPAPAAPQLPQPTGASPAFFTGMQPPVINGQQQTGVAARQRPLAPQYTQGQGGALMPPPPARPLSAPQSAQPSAFTPPPLQPQMTGNPNMYQQPQQQIAPPGQSLAEINQARLLQQQYAQQMQQQQMMMPQPTGFVPQNQQFMQPQPTGFPNQFMPQQQQPMMNGPNQMQQSPFADPRPQQQQQFGMMPQPTGFQPQFQPQQQPQQFMPQPTGINSFLPPALEPQRTGMPFTQGFGNAPQQQAPPMQPLVPQKTGPPPPVRFGVSAEAKKLMPQATGRRANLAQATPNNPFGF